MTNEIINVSLPLIIEQEREAKITELDNQSEAFLNAYNATCEAKGIRPDFVFLFENFGIGARDAYTDEDLDAMIAEDKRKVQERQNATD